MDYIYKALVTGVYDGDTITVDIDFGMNIWRRDVKLRLARIDTPELRGEERPKGLLVRDYVRDLILNKYVIIKTIKDSTGKYGRYLAEVFINDLHLNNHLVEKGMAVKYK